MQILQRFPWPPESGNKDLLNMYFFLDKPVSWSSTSGFHDLGPMNVIKLSTYFGAFSLSTWCSCAGINEVVVRIKASGGGLIRIIHFKPDNTQEVLSETVLKRKLSNDEEWIEIFLENLSGKEGIIYPEISVSEEKTSFAGLEYLTSQSPRYPVRIAMIMTTFKREEYIQKNLEKVLQILPKYKGHLSLFIVDNGRTLKIDPISQDVTIIPNGNFGGAGGFGKGLLKALDDPKEFTHFLFCDDDIEFETETICRTYSLWQYLDGKTSVMGGAMLSMEKKDIISAAGEFYDLKGTNAHFSKPAIATLSQNLVAHDLRTCTNYFAWWYFSFSRDIYNLIGMPLPIFVKGDDIDYGLRLSKIPVKFVTLLGCGVWHEDFSKKRTAHIMEFYTSRNMLIVNAIHGGSYIKTLFRPLNKIINYILSYRYLQAKLVLFSYSEFLKGPENLMSNFRQAPRFHSQLTKDFQFETIKESSESNQELLTKISTPLYLKILIILTLNGHLLPTFFFKKGFSQKCEDYGSFKLINIFRYKHIIYHDRISGKRFVHHHDKKTFFFILIGIVLVFTKAIIVFPFLRKKYQTFFSKMTSEIYWRDVLNDSH